MLKAVQEKLVFLSKFSRSPRQIGSVTPSSVYLARKMVRQVDWAATEAVAELGAGTGAITKQIVGSMKSGTACLLFEKDDDLRAGLRERFPECVCCDDAARLCDHMQAARIDGLDCVISGLPFFNFPPQLREKLIGQVADALKPGGLFVAFQYSQQMKRLLSRHFVLEKILFVPLNVPPAFVYVCRRKEDKNDAS